MRYGMIRPFVSSLVRIVLINRACSSKYKNESYWKMIRRCAGRREHRYREMNALYDALANANLDFNAAAIASLSGMTVALQRIRIAIPCL
jgi:hypothetical protein